MVMNDKKSWPDSLVISGRSARQLGYVKEIKWDPDSNHENLIVVPFSSTWLPKEVTGACQFSSDAVSGSGDGCLIVNEPDNISFISQSDLGKKLVQRTQALWYVATGVTQIFGISLLLLSLSPLLLV